MTTATRDPNDVEGRIKDELAAVWDPQTGADPHPDCTVTLHVSDSYVPADDNQLLLVAYDGGPPIFGSSWFINSPRRPLFRLTAFAAGRDTARRVVLEAANWVNSNPGVVGITRIEDVSDPLITRDRDTGAYLASVTMPTIVRPK